MHNACSMLQPGGYFIGTIPNDLEIMFVYYVVMLFSFIYKSWSKLKSYLYGFYISFIL